MRGFIGSVAAAVVLACTLGTSPAALAHDEDHLHIGLRPASPQPSALAPGLQAIYHWTYVRHIRTLERFAQGRKGDARGVLPTINYKTGRGNVMTTQRTDGVGAHITGFIKFDRAGEYVFLVNSNDGVRFTLGGVKLHEDPLVHADEMTDPIRVKIDRPGWYPVVIWYYERKGTSTLQLFWKVPGATGDPVIVPAGAFGHTPG